MGAYQSLLSGNRTAGTPPIQEGRPLILCGPKVVSLCVPIADSDHCRSATLQRERQPSSRKCATQDDFGNPIRPPIGEQEPDQLYKAGEGWCEAEQPAFRSQFKEAILSCIFDCCNRPCLPARTQVEPADDDT